MALSFSAVEKAYKVFNEINKIIPLSIGSLPEDMTQWEDRKQENPEENKVYGFDRKSDYGWESLVFFVKNPSNELKQKFDDLKKSVPNSSISKPYSRNDKYWIFGWF